MINSHCSHNQENIFKRPLRTSVTGGYCPCTPTLSTVLPLAFLSLTGHSCLSCPVQLPLPTLGDPGELGPVPTFQALPLSLQPNIPITGPWFKLAGSLKCSQPCPCLLSSYHFASHPALVRSSPWQSCPEQCWFHLSHPLKALCQSGVHPSQPCVRLSGFTQQTGAFLLASFPVSLPRFHSASALFLFPCSFPSVIPMPGFPACLLCPTAGFSIV